MARNETDDAAELRPANLDARVADPAAFNLDTHLRDTMQAIHTAAPQIGQQLQLLVDHRLYRPLGFQSVDAYVRERLGISPRTAWALIKIEKAARRAPAFADAYAGGTFSWARTLTLLPGFDHEMARGWIARPRGYGAGSRTR